jgi:hypothetical protein
MVTFRRCTLSELNPLRTRRSGRAPPVDGAHLDFGWGEGQGWPTQQACPRSKSGRRGNQTVHLGAPLRSAEFAATAEVPSLLHVARVGETALPCYRATNQWRPG